METKFCKTCLTEKDVLLFNKNSASKDGLERMCKTCKSEYRKKSDEKNREKNLEKRKQQYALNPEKYRMQGKQNYKKHKEKRISKVKEWQSKNNELVNLYKKKNYELKKTEYKHNSLIRYHTEEGKQKHKQRMDKYSQTEKGKIANRIKRARRRHIEDSTKCDFTSTDWENCLKHFGNVCAYCGSSECISQDHVIPVTKLGSFTADNIIPACKSCNSSKNNKDFSDWYKTRPYYTNEKHNKILNYINSHQ